MDLIFDLVGRRHGSMVGAAQRRFVHPVNQILDTFFVGTYAFVLQQVLCFLADGQVIGARSRWTPFAVHGFLVVAQLPVKQHHHPRMIFVFDDVGLQTVVEHLPVQGIVVGGIGIGLLPVVFPQVVVQVFGHGELFQFVAGLDGFFLQFAQIARGHLRLAFFLGGLDLRPEPGIVVLCVHGKDKSGHQGDRP